MNSLIFTFCARQSSNQGISLQTWLEFISHQMPHSLKQVLYCGIYCTFEILQKQKEKDKTCIVIFWSGQNSEYSSNLHLLKAAEANCPKALFT